MRRFGRLIDLGKNFLIAVAVYVLCHGITALVVTPAQKLFLSDITVFASLIYLPHGVRVLATWLSGWRAVIPLFAGALLSEVMFTPALVFDFLEPVILWSIFVGAMSAYVSFVLIKFLGRDLFADRERVMDWKWLLIAGAVASVVNSVGQVIVFSGLIVPDDLFAVLVTYAIGDLVGLYVSMLVLMMVFRWMRLFSDAK